MKTSRLLVIDAIWSEDLYIVQSVWEDGPNQRRRTEINSTRKADDFIAQMADLANAMVGRFSNAEATDQTGRERRRHHNPYSQSA